MKGIPTADLNQAFINLKDMLCKVCSGVVIDPFICDGCRALTCKVCTASMDCSVCPAKKLRDCQAELLSQLNIMKFKCKNCQKVRKYINHVSHLKQGCKQDKYLCHICMKFEGSKLQKEEHVQKCILDIKSKQVEILQKVQNLEKENRMLQ